jgi:hypothetical protein
MYQGYVVEYIGSKNIPASKKTNFAMFRGVVFRKNEFNNWIYPGAIVYDPNYLYRLTGEIVDTRVWPKDDRKE